MAVVVGTPNIDDTVETALGKLVVVVGNIGGKVGGYAVGAHQHIVLQLGNLSLG